MVVVLFPTNLHINLKECNNLYIIYFTISYVQRKSEDVKESTESIVYFIYN